MEKLIEILSSKELVAKMKKILEKKKIVIEEEKLTEILNLTKKRMEVEGISGGDARGVAKAAGILSGAILGSVSTGKLIPKYIGFKDTKNPIEANFIAGSALTGGMVGGYLGNEFAEMILDYLEDGSFHTS